MWRCKLQIARLPTMKPLEQKRDESKAGNAAVNVSAEAASVSAPSVQIDLTKVKIEIGRASCRERVSSPV